MTVVGAGLATALVALIFERFFISRVYGRNVLMQLLVCYGFILIFDDLVKLFWGAEFKSMGMPSAFRVPRAHRRRRRSAVLSLLGRGHVGDRTGVVARYREDPPRQDNSRCRAKSGNDLALGVNTGLLYGLVLALGGLLAGLAGALAAPVRSLTPGMGCSILIESFIVTVIGGIGSIVGAFAFGALMIGLIRTFGSMGFPLFTDGLMYLFMVIVLFVKPTGLFGKEIA